MTLRNRFPSKTGRSDQGSEPLVGAGEVYKPQPHQQRSSVSGTSGRRSLWAGLVLVVIAHFIHWKFFPLSPERASWIKIQFQKVWLVSAKYGWIEEKNYFDTDKNNYYALYPELKIIEDNWKVIQGELRTLLKAEHAGVDFSSMFEGKMYQIQWSSLWLLMAGEWIPENEALAPQTAALLKNFTGLDSALFSTLQPHQYILPHYGYWRGYSRYHLGLLVPGNNANRSALLRVQPKKLLQVFGKDNYEWEMEGANEHYYHEGEGVLWDDTYLHDSRNANDEPRTVLWLDIRRRDLPWYMRLFSDAVLWVAFHDSYLQDRRQQAVVGNPEIMEKIAAVRSSMTAEGEGTG